MVSVASRRSCGRCYAKPDLSQTHRYILAGAIVYHPKHRRSAGFISIASRTHSEHHEPEGAGGGGGWQRAHSHENHTPCLAPHYCCCFPGHPSQNTTEGGEAPKPPHTQYFHRCFNMMRGQLKQLRSSYPDNHEGACVRTIEGD